MSVVNSLSRFLFHSVGNQTQGLVFARKCSIIELLPSPAQQHNMCVGLVVQGAQDRTRARPPAW